MGDVLDVLAVGVVAEGDAVDVNAEADSEAGENIEGIGD